MTEINHERCSELLAGHHRSELGPEDASAVERHLAGCEDCRAELAGLRALAEAVDFDPLGDDERQRLRDAVTREVRIAPGQVYELPARRTFWERHAGQVVGAAASIVVILFAYLAIGLPGRDDSGDDAGDGGGGGEAATVQEDSALDADAGSEGPQPVFVTADGRAVAEGAQDDATESDPPPSALLRLQTRSKHTERSIQELGGSGPIFRDFGEAYTTDDAGLAEDFLNQLASEAPDDELRDRVLECGAGLLGDDPERPLLPAFATVAEFMDQESLILGFVTTDGLTPELNRYTIWAWPVDNCDVILIGTGGEIRP